MIGKGCVERPILGGLRQLFGAESNQDQMRQGQRCQRNNQPAKTDGLYRKHRSIQVEHDHERHTECERDYEGRSHVDQTGRRRIPGRGDLQWSGTPDTPDMDW